MGVVYVGHVALSVWAGGGRPKLRWA